MNTPNTLQEAIVYFSDVDRCFAHAVSLRWENGVVSCPRCGSDKHSFIKTRRIWSCKGCKKQFTVKVGTVMEDSPIGLDKWMCAMWMLSNCRNGVSSYEIHRSLGVTQKTAWFMLQRIRLAMQEDDSKPMSGVVEMDETFIGGKAKNMHANDRKRKIAEPNKGNDLAHEIIHHVDAYVRGHVHTNGIENFWSMLKRALGGTYISVEPFHLFRYIDEQMFRFNNRCDCNDRVRFENVMAGVFDKRLTYDELTGTRLAH